MSTTTIPVSQQVRDRLQRYGHAGQTYTQILQGLMDQIDREAFVAEMRQRVDAVKRWDSLDDL